MKLRIRDNSIRLRLTQSEVQLFHESGKVAATIHFGDNQLVYALEKADCQALSASYNQNKICILVPTAMANTWATTEQVGMETDGDLKILVEKDFQCLVDRGEDDTDTFPNPNAKNDR